MSHEQPERRNDKKEEQPERGSEWYIVNHKKRKMIELKVKPVLITVNQSE